MGVVLECDFVDYAYEAFCPFLFIFREERGCEVVGMGGGGFFGVLAVICPCETGLAIWDPGEVEVKV